MTDWIRKQQSHNDSQAVLIETFHSIFSHSPTWSIDAERDALHIENRSAKGNSQPIRKVQELMKYLLGFRNALIHAEPITNKDIHKASIVLEVLLQASLPLNRFVMRSKVKDTVYELRGMFPSVRNDLNHKMTDIGDKDLVLFDGDRRLFSLSPLLSLAQNIEKIDGANEIFFINAGSIQLLKYVGFINGEQQDGKSLGSYDTFKQYLSTIPIPAGGTDVPLIDFLDFTSDKAKNFVGRTDVLNEIYEHINVKGGHYIFLKALPGMGKSAILAKLYQQNYELHEQTSDGENHWLFHFCMRTEGRDQSVTAYRSLITQLQMALGNYSKKRKPSMDINELKDQFQSLLNGAKETLEKQGRQKIIIALDALDEVSFIEEDNIISCIPEFIQEHVMFLCSYRVSDEHQNVRVETRLQHLPSEKCVTLRSANPLNGLTQDDVWEFLDKINNLDTVSDSTQRTVWNAASQDLSNFADPFYLRFLADGVEKKQYYLSRPESIPLSLNGAFESMWLSLPSDKDFLAHRLLVTLGIMRDLGDDELFAELFTRQLNESFTPEDIATIRRPIGKLLTYDGDRYGLFHDRFRIFLVGEQKDPIAEALRMQHT